MSKPVVIILDGALGEGKSTLAVHIAKYFNEKNGQKGFNFDVQYGFGANNFASKLRECYENKYKVCIYDEAGDFSKRGALSRTNAMLNRIFETFRAYKIIIILCLPTFFSLDAELYPKGVVRMLIHCYDRNNEYSNFSVFGSNRAQWLRNKMSKFVVKQAAYKTSLPNFYGHFLDLPPEESQRLDKITTKEKLKDLMGSEVNIQGLMNYRMMAQKIGKSMHTTYITAERLKLKPTRTVKRVKYFDQAAFDVLAGQFTR